jgi:UDPglucose 6-dehydrogenase
MTIGVVGLGKLGACLAGLFASRGFEVLGIDSNGWLVDEIKNGRCPINETGLKELLASCDDKLKVTTSYDGVSVADIIFIIVPTPSEDNGRFSNEHIITAVKSIGEDIKATGYTPLVVITSTVVPSSCEKVIMPELEEVAGKRISVCYNPEFIALGSVIRDMEQPDSILIGESDKEAGDLLSAFYDKLHNTNSPPISRMSLWNAELAKIALNTFITTKISLANTYAMLCSVMPQGNVDDITNFLGMDSRIGKKYLKGGLGYSGECFPRDCRAFGVVAKQLGIPSPLQEATDAVNMSIVDWVASDVDALMTDNDSGTVSVLGLTFKPNTPVVTESQSLEIAQRLSADYRVKVYDPMGMENAKKNSGDYDLLWCESAYECLAGSSMCVLVTPWDEFQTITPSEIKNAMFKPIVYDCWRFWDRKAMVKAGIKYYALGLRNDE